MGTGNASSLINGLLVVAKGRSNCNSRQTTKRRPILCDYLRSSVMHEAYTSDDSETDDGTTNKATAWKLKGD
jgi:hypothetical protein